MADEFAQEHYAIFFNDHFYFSTLKIACKSVTTHVILKPRNSVYRC